MIMACVAVMGRDKYGRILANVFNGRGGTIVMDLMNNNMAVPYEGRGKKKNWCEE